MTHEPEQVGSRMCGCRDCLIDFPPERYGYRPPQGTCRGPWRVRYRGTDEKHRRKDFSTLREAYQFLATVQPKARCHAS